jgi:hypothetical protein
VSAQARGRLRTWREEQLLTRKVVRGIIFDLQNNSCYRERKEPETGPAAAGTMRAAEMSMGDKMAILRELAISLKFSEVVWEPPDGGAANSPVLRGRERAEGKRVEDGGD